MLKKQVRSDKKGVSNYIGVVVLGVLCAILFAFMMFQSQQRTVTRRMSQIRIADKTLNYSVEQRKKIAQLVMKQTQSGLKKQGVISIPKVGILLPIFNSAYTKRGLNAGANYANRNEFDLDGKQKPIMGKSNYGLAAHNFNDGKTAFSALQQYTNNDKPYLFDKRPRVNRWLSGKMIYMANQDGIYAYRIMYQELVKQGDVKVLNPTSTPQVTIVSCLYPSHQYRIITKGKLVKKYGWINAPDSIIKAVDLLHRKTNAHVTWWNPGKEEGLE